jgi:hypothetical protein
LILSYPMLQHRGQRKLLPAVAVHCCDTCRHICSRALHKDANGALGGGCHLLLLAARAATGAGRVAVLGTAHAGRRCFPAWHVKQR